MGKNINHIQHLKSSVVVENGGTVSPKLPTPDLFVDGEIAVNYADGYETLSIKSSSGNVVTFSSDDYYSEKKLGSAFTGENSAITVTKCIEDNEKVISSALNDLNENKLNVSEFETYSGAVNTTVTAHTADTTIHFTTGTVQTQINNSISGKLDTDIYSAFSATVRSEIDDLSGQCETVAAALVDLNSRTVANANDIETISYALNALDEKFLKEITYAELVTLRNNGELEPGAKYRITDYVTTTMQPNTRSAGHQFDIIVTADAPDKLNENAHAALHAEIASIRRLYKTDGLKYSNEVDTEEYFDYVGTFSFDGVTYYRWQKYEKNDETEYSILTRRLWLPNELSVENYSEDFIVLVDDTLYGDRETNRGDRLVYVEGSGYFYRNKLEAWELKYRLDNINWSSKIGTHMISTSDGRYIFFKDGTVEINGTTYIMWRNSLFEEDWGCVCVVSKSETVDSQLYVWYGDDEGPDEEFGVIDTVTIEQNGGKGTITWMRDEFNNECPYDFKNIQFKRYKATDTVSERQGLSGLYMIANPDEVPTGLEADSDDFIWAFTFSSDSGGGAQTDYSLGGHDVYSNVFEKEVAFLPNNVLFGTFIYSNSFGTACNYNSIGSGFYNNSIGNYFYNNSIGNDFYSNSIGNNSYNNSIGNDFYSNSIGNYFYNNSIGNNSYSNSIGNNFGSNSIGNNFGSNSIGNYFNSNSIGNDFYNNSIGNDFGSNSIGNSFNSNSIGNDFGSNSIGNDFGGNSIGNDFGSNSIGNISSYNSIGNNCHHIRFLKDNIYNVIVENSNQYIDITSTKTTSISSKLRNFKIAQGVNNTSAVKTISHDTVNDTFQTVYQPINSQTISV